MPSVTRRSLLAVRAWVLLLVLAGAVASAVCAPSPTQAASDPDIAPPSVLIDSRRLLDDLKTLSADDMQGRRIGTPGGERARAYVVSRFTALGLEPVGGSYAHPFSARAANGTGAVLAGANVVGLLTGSQTPDRYLVVSAHYDHVGVIRGEVYNGADDNASGTAALFALAEYFKTHPPRHSLLFVAFDGEEEGLLGSRVFVARSPVPLAAMGADVNADMVARDDTDTLWITGTFQQPFLKPYIARVAASAPVHLRMGHDDPNEGLEDWTADSDQYSFMQAHVPAIYVGVSDDAQHHKPTDDYETITRPFYVRAVETLVRIVEEFDGHLDVIGHRGTGASGHRIIGSSDHRAIGVSE